MEDIPSVDWAECPMNDPAALATGPSERLAPPARSQLDLTALFEAGCERLEVLWEEVAYPEVHCH